MSRNTSADIVAQQEDEARRRPRGRTVRPLLALVPFIMKYPGMIAGAFVALVMATLATLAMPIAVRFMIDNGFSRDDAGSIDSYFLALLVVAIVLGAASAAPAVVLGLLSAFVLWSHRAQFPVLSRFA